MHFLKYLFKKLKISKVLSANRNLILVQNNPALQIYFKGEKNK